MARKYRKVEQLVPIFETRSQAGETYREIRESLGLTRDEVRGAMHRHHAKERNNEIMQLRMHAVHVRRAGLVQKGCPGVEDWL